MFSHGIYTLMPLFHLRALLVRAMSVCTQSGSNQARGSRDHHSCNVQGASARRHHWNSYRKSIILQMKPHNGL
ncbi:hypothetical protein A0H81_11918 [Grifola frondosa]|uniref:Secreted protein n=1 Tax=Grifola frondosa TaxID=5627 RepID=A0A1C7LZD5_GRIFR|nr:hypothetical protein A0H81_11918 [Grifola frondosa]